MEIRTDEGTSLVFAPDEKGLLYFREAFDSRFAKKAVAPKAGPKVFRGAKTTTWLTDAVESGEGTRLLKVSMPSAVAGGESTSQGGTEKWSVAALRNRRTRSAHGRRTCWQYLVANNDAGTAAVVSEDDIRKLLPHLRPAALTLRHYYREKVCGECHVKLAESDGLCALCLQAATFGPCSECGRQCAQTAKFKKFGKCLDCWRRDDLARSGRTCPRCGEKIPCSKTWWASCYPCFLRARGKQVA